MVKQQFPGRHPVTDLHFHGTHVAATVSSNGVRAAGVTSSLTLMGVKVLGTDGNGAYSSILEGLKYAVDHGADVVNMSLGTVFDEEANEAFIGVLNRAVKYARRRGVTVVVAAGNDALDMDHARDTYNAFCSAPGIICVAATGPTGAAWPEGPYENIDAPAPYSNYGRRAITVAAPGGAHEPVWAACSTSSLALAPCRGSARGPVVGLSGTSMASPHVAALAALLVPYYGRDPHAIKGQIEHSSDDLGPEGCDPHYGYGRINVARGLGVR
jgi:subtilisin family serine protease